MGASKTKLQKVEEQRLFRRERSGPTQESKPSNNQDSNTQTLTIEALKKLDDGDAKDILPFLLKNIQKFASFLDNDESAKHLNATELLLRILIKGHETTPMPGVFDEVFKKFADSKFFVNVNKVCSSIIQKEDSDHADIVSLALNINERLLYRFPISVLPNAIALSATVDWMCEEAMNEEMQSLHANLKRDIEYHFRHSKGQRPPDETRDNTVCSEVKVECQDSYKSGRDKQSPKALCIDDQEHVEKNGEQKCDFRLPCGHTCPRQYHTDDRNHTDKTKHCEQPCERAHCTNQAHKCRRLCGEECGRCDYETEVKLPRCGHVRVVKCGQNLDEILCKEPCRSRLPCGHQCRAGCGRACTKVCQVPDKELQLACGHTQMILCGENLMEAVCKTPCKTVLQCDHPCSGTCGICYRGHLHQSCTTKCERTLVCGHLCKEPCTKDCPPCEEKCANRCMHSMCQQQCGEECIKCKEKCVWLCEHKRCTKLCFELCDRDRCNEPCKRKIACGHHCIGLCGEPCPKLCRICDQDTVKDIFFGDEDEDDTKFVELSDCGHIFSVEGLDHWMDNTTTTENEDTAIQLKRCPKCNKEIRQHLRYGNVIKKSLTDIEKAKLLIHGNVEENLTDVQYIRQAVVSANQFVNHLSKVFDPRQKADNEQAKSTDNVKVALDSVKELWQHLHAFISSEKAHRQQRRTVVSMRYKTDFMNVLMEMIATIQRNEGRYENKVPGTYNMFIKDLEKVTDYIIFADGNDRSPRITFSAQHLDDIEWFLTRLKQLGHYMTLSMEKQKPSRIPEKTYGACQSLLLNTAPYRQETMEAVTHYFEQMEKLNEAVTEKTKPPLPAKKRQYVTEIPMLPQPLPTPSTSKMATASKITVTTDNNNRISDDKRKLDDIRYIRQVLLDTTSVMSNQPSALLEQNEKLRDLLEHVRRFLGNAANEPRETVATMKVKADFLTDIVKLIQKLEANIREKSIQFHQIEYYNDFMKGLDQIVSIITYGDQKTQHKNGIIISTFSDQDITDVRWMIKRLDQFGQFLVFSFLLKRKGKQYAGLDTCRQVLFNSFPYREVARNEVQGHLDNMEKICNEQADGISREELIQITQAMGLTTGHWYRCRNGHMYAVGESGGAVEESRCNECGAAIGGRDFEPVDGNEYAPEMDRQSMNPANEWLAANEYAFQQSTGSSQVKPMQSMVKPSFRPAFGLSKATPTSGAFIASSNSKQTDIFIEPSNVKENLRDIDDIKKIVHAVNAFINRNKNLNKSASDTRRNAGQYLGFGFGQETTGQTRKVGQGFGSAFGGELSERRRHMVGQGSGFGFGGQPLQQKRNVEQGFGFETKAPTDSSRLAIARAKQRQRFPTEKDTHVPNGWIKIPDDDQYEYSCLKQIYDQLNKFVTTGYVVRTTERETVLVMKTKADFLQQIVQVLEIFEADLKKKGIKRKNIQDYDLLERDLTMIATTIISSDRRSFSNQEKENINCFIARLGLFRDFTILSTVLKKKGKTYPELDKCRQTLLNIFPYNRRTAEKEVKRHMKAMEDLRKALPGLGITSTERVQITRAVGLAKGHWFKCPNGHVYAIGDCGGAQQSSRCPECGAAIGGQNHRLATGNTLAHEMDGARFAAWSEQANMGNYDPRELERLARF